MALATYFYLRAETVQITPSKTTLDIFILCCDLAILAWTLAWNGRVSLSRLTKSDCCVKI